MKEKCVYKNNTEGSNENNMCLSNKNREQLDRTDTTNVFRLYFFLSKTVQNITRNLSTGHCCLRPVTYALLMFVQD